jgi:hypothetical protein
MLGIALPMLGRSLLTTMLGRSLLTTPPQSKISRAARKRGDLRSSLRRSQRPAPNKPSAGSETRAEQGGDPLFRFLVLTMLGRCLPTTMLGRGRYVGAWSPDHAPAERDFSCGEKARRPAVEPSAGSETRAEQGGVRDSRRTSAVKPSAGSETRAEQGGDPLFRFLVLTPSFELLFFCYRDRAPACVKIGYLPPCLCQEAWRWKTWIVGISRYWRWRDISLSVCSCG